MVNMNGFLLYWMVSQLVFKIGFTAPSIEPCPVDSKIEGDVCVCDLKNCGKPPCLYELKLIKEGTKEPGSCCPIYSCEGCKNDTLLEGKCPCAPGAILDEKGICMCVDKERLLVDGECKCNRSLCELPTICDRKSVLTIIEDGCCRRTRCVPCPEDSESTNLDTEFLEDHCVCLPCVKDCGANKTAIILKKGTGFPGNCCDIIECKSVFGERNISDECVVGDIIYSNGEKWWSSDAIQQCICKNGLSLCTTEYEYPDEREQKCFDEGVLYRHNETWKKDKNCTFCACIHGENKCVSHYCDETKDDIYLNPNNIKENTTIGCIRRNLTYEHLEEWNTEENGKCEHCKCLNGDIKCDFIFCMEKEVTEISGECLPLLRCSKKCVNGYKVKKGCEICKCNAPTVIDVLLNKYNISFDDFLNLLDNYKKNHDHQSLSSSTFSTTTTSTSSTDVEIFRIEDDEALITPAFLPKEDRSCWIIIAVLSASIFIMLATFLVVHFYKNNRKYSVTPTRGSYHSVLNTTATDNNNTIKKNSITFNNNK